MFISLLAQRNEPKKRAPRSNRIPFSRHYSPGISNTTLSHHQMKFQFGKYFVRPAIPQGIYVSIAKW